ncbi:hypothetical protein JG687_00017278 [Phytophthora cactorum]|uniref:Uncharacterized protein n=1 Tax=Phytophthora cactorum TaxID=29920 RepID=A0A329SC22_9STRA|nr:hypothetical protein Pcac1_g18175 [Phytophthora cactorum]KAG2824936.1 hypothetical protein PC111_g9599 [Phytophthora cactorum]KAG2842290.1 hypothetical protein PC112_g3069 [Phytophthora cactorum]KAG2922679.1 hypothetical protein PC114_g5156 [Phytophthora cactorum]KAG2947179.1 hypothetical protein PC117_g7006 [Phytophthora cactorum]
MSGQQIMELGDYLLQTELRDNWNGISSEYINEQQQRGIQTSHAAVATSEDSIDKVTSPPLASYMDMLRDNGALGADLGFESLSKARTIPDVPKMMHSAATMMDRSKGNILEHHNFSLEHQQMEISSTTIVAAKAHRCPETQGISKQESLFMIKK